MWEWSQANTFLYQDARIFDDSFHGFEEVLQNSSSSPQGIRFEFHHPLESLHRLKSLILKYKEVSNWDNLYFFNTSDFVNIVLEKEVYLPKNINLFINESCFIGCNFCENPNDIKTYLKLEDIKSFLKLYNIGDDINFNILGQGDPLFNPELFDILEYIHSLWAHITFFSWWKSLLYTDKMEELFSYVDEFKINLSCFSYESYNAYS